MYNILQFRQLGPLPARAGGMRLQLVIRLADRRMPGRGRPADAGLSSTRSRTLFTDSDPHLLLRAQTGLLGLLLLATTTRTPPNAPSPTPPDTKLIRSSFGTLQALSLSKTRRFKFPSKPRPCADIATSTEIAAIGPRRTGLGGSILLTDSTPSFASYFLHLETRRGPSRLVARRV